jgi:hypothetical protein
MFTQLISFTVVNGGVIDQWPIFYTSRQSTDPQKRNQINQNDSRDPQKRNYSVYKHYLTNRKTQVGNSPTPRIEITEITVFMYLPVGLIVFINTVIAFAF